MDGIDKASASRLPNRIEVQLPRYKPAADSEKALRQSIYSMKSKRKKTELDDSEDEYDTDASPDAKLARRLQDEDNKSITVSSSVRRSARASLARVSNFLDDEDDLAYVSKSSSSASLKAKGKAAVTTTSTLRGQTSTQKTSRNPKKSIIKSEDDEDEEEEEDDDDDDDEDVAPEDVDSDSDVPLYRPTKRARVSTRSATKPKTSSTPATTSRASTQAPPTSTAAPAELDFDELLEEIESDQEWRSNNNGSSSDSDEAPAAEDEAEAGAIMAAVRRAAANRRAYRSYQSRRRVKKERDRLEEFHPELKTMWTVLENMPVLKAGKAEQPGSISRQLKPFQLEGLAWMREMEKIEWKGGILGDEMGLGKTIQAVSLIMSDWPAKQPSLVLVPPVALMQWMTEIESYTDGTLKTLVFHGTNSKSKNLTVKDLKKYDVIIMSYNSLESMYRKQEKGFKRKEGLYKETSVIHQTRFHRVILDEAHSIKTRTTMTAKACFALKVDFRWCLSGTPLQNRIGEFFSLIRFLNIQPFACYLCKQCPCSSLEWSMDADNRCTHCNHGGMRHVSVFNQELLNPIQKYGNKGLGADAFKKLRILTDRIMLRRLKKDHTNAMELPVKEIYVDRQFFGEEENDFANSIMSSGQRRFDTYVSQGVLLNNYANIFGLIMQMRQVADHPDLILKKDSAGGQNILVCCICDEPAEEAIRSRCKHDFCRSCAKSYLLSSDQPDCPRCHIPLSIDLEQPEIEQDEDLVKKSSIINRIKMENWTSSSKIELLVHELHKLRSDNASHKSIIFSQFTTMLQLIEWRLRRAGITTVMLDGSMTPAQRQASIEHFMKNVDVECFLVSLKAGGVALNLTEASRVFIIDP
jgi:DNA repair protein RAD16